MVGPETGKIINYSVRSKDCIVCSRAESRNESQREHTCYRNWEGKPLSSSSLQKSLENVFEGYAQNSIKLSTIGSTDANESFNRMVSAKAPKHVHYSSSGNLNYIVAASVAQKNTGHRYLVNTKEREFVSQPARACEACSKLQIEGPSDRQISLTGKKHLPSFKFDTDAIWNHNSSVFASLGN
ncbi:unnamed protein product [Mytilus coruscus]|uniref:Mutator-like transposase domain-containing protein n=1 Tax=Mytilus coruscus TaxID=42192 RepID=A0A6J8A3G7_MYTCO|nr:unnamed protein product [Mytilus coruscus]